MKESPARIHPDEPLDFEDLSRLRWRLIWIYEAPLEGSMQRLPYCAYPTAAWLVRKGTVRLFFPSGEESYKAGQWVFPPQSEGVQSFSLGAKILSVRFQAEWPDGTPLFERRQSVVVDEHDPAAVVLEKAAGRLLRFLEQRVPAQVEGRRLLHLSLVDYLDMQPLVSAWIAAYFHLMTQHGPTVKFRNPNEKVEAILYRLQSHPLDQPLRIANLAREASLSVSQLNKIFVRETGTTPAAFWKERRLNAARSWLLYGSDSIKAIAHDLGFSSPENFSHWFRHLTDLAPQHFRDSQPHL